MDDELRVVEMGEYKLRFENDEEIGEWFEEKAQKELRETPELREEALRQLIDTIDSKLHHVLITFIFDVQTVERKPDLASVRV